MGETVWWQRDLSAYPSPAAEFVIVDLPEGKQGELYLLNMEGQLVLHISDVSTEQRIDVSKLPSGIYSIEFLPEKNEDRVVYTKRVLVD